MEKKQETDIVEQAITKAMGLRNEKKLSAAIALLVDVQKKNKTHPHLNFQLSRLFGEIGNLEPAIRHAEISLKNAGARPPLNLLLHRGGLDLLNKDPAHALQIAQTATELYQNDPRTYSLGGRALAALKNYPAAIQMLEAAVNLGPKNSSYLNQLAQTLELAGDFERALIVFGFCRNAENPPKNVTMLMANLLQRMDRYDDSLALYRRALKELGHKSYLYMNMGALFRRFEATENAYRCYQQSLVLDPGDGGSYYNLGNLERGRLNVDVADKWFQMSTIIEPENGTFHWNSSLVKLLKGEIEAGFAEYEWRWQHDGFPSRRRNFSQPQWQGDDYSGKTLLVHAEQGMGDHFQFVRFMPMIAALKGKGGKLILECHEPLMNLLQTFPGVDQIIERNVDDPSQLPKFDLHLPIVSAPFALGMKTVDDLPTAVPYLTIPDGPDFELPNADPKALKIGFVWGGNPGFGDDHKRSTKIDYYQPLFDIPGTQFFSIQKGPREPEISEAPEKVVRLNAQIEDFRDTAVLMTKLDLVITTCTSVAHLAGALGRPTWILLHTTADWRWLMEPESSVWYPTARLFRQPSDGDWQSVFDAVGAAITARVAEQRKSAKA